MVARVWHEIEVGNKESNHKINGIERYASGYKMYAFTAIDAVFGVLWCGVCMCRDWKEHPVRVDVTEMATVKMQCT